MIINKLGGAQRKLTATEKTPVMKTDDINKTFYFYKKNARVFIFSPGIYLLNN